MTARPPVRYDLRWTRANELALIALCVAAGSLLAWPATSPGRTGTPPAVNAQRVEQATERINPNLAPVHSLVRLPAIGPARAKAIIAHRKAHGPRAFRWVGDLAPVKGIGPATLAAVAPYLSLPAQPPDVSGD